MARRLARLLVAAVAAAAVLDILSAWRNPTVEIDDEVQPVDAQLAALLRQLPGRPTHVLLRKPVGEMEPGLYELGQR